MTFRDIVGAMLRRWYMVLVILLAASYLTMSYVRNSGCYTSVTVVTFTLPAASPLQPDSGTDDSNVIAFASAIADEINGGQSQSLYADADAPFYGAGVRQGVSVGLPNFGGQWATSYATAQIEIQIVGRTYAWVDEQQRAALARIDAAASSQQSIAAPAQHISATVERPTQIFHVLPTRSSRMMAFAAMGIATFIGSTITSLIVDRLAVQAGQRRRARRARRVTTKPIEALS